MHCVHVNNTTHREENGNANPQSFLNLCLRYRDLDCLLQRLIRYAAIVHQSSICSIRNFKGRPVCCVDRHNTHMEKQTPRTSEIGLMLDGPASRIDETYRLWKSKGVQIVQPPYDDVFGRTFVVADPDGNLIRVSPVD